MRRSLSQRRTDRWAQNFIKLKNHESRTKYGLRSFWVGADLTALNRQMGSEEKMVSTKFEKNLFFAIQDKNVGRVNIFV